jgi:hypothetical protein
MTADDVIRACGLPSALQRAPLVLVEGVKHVRAGGG